MKLFFFRNDPPYGESEMDALKKHLGLRNWKFTDNPNEADILFFGSGDVPKAFVESDKPKVCYFWGWPYFRMLDEYYRLLYQDKVRDIGKCDVILTPTAVSAYQAYDFGLEPAIVGFGVDRARFEAVPSQAPKNQVIVITRLVDYKRVDMVVRGVALSKSKPKLVVICCGEEQDKKLLKAYAESLKVDLEIRELHPETYVDEKIAAIKESKMLITASEYEGYGIPPAEALMCDRPALCRDIPVLREVYKENVRYFINEWELAGLIDVVGAYVDEKYVIPDYVKKQYDVAVTAYAVDNCLNDLIKQRLGEKIRANITDKEVYKEAYDVEHQRDFLFNSYRYNPDWERHWRVGYALKGLIGKSVLDLGCSYGVYSIHFARNNYDVTAVDCSPVALKQTRDNLKKYGFEGKVSVVEAFADNLPFDDNSFDSLWCGEVLEHIPDHLLEKSLKEMLRVVRSGGRLVFSTPFMEHHDDHLHLRHYDVEGFKKSVLSVLGDKVRVLELTLIAEDGKDPSCIFCVLEVGK